MLLITPAAASALHPVHRLVLAGALLAGLIGPAAAQIILPNQSGQDLPQVPTFRPKPPPDVQPSWTLRNGTRPPPRRWERTEGFAAPPAFGGPRDARPRSPILE